MNLNNLITIIRRKKRRLGQGYGSGRGKTAGRGTKGQKARGMVSISFEGGGVSLIKRLPFMRGKGRFKPVSKKPIIVNLDSLNRLKKNSKVDIKTLIENNIIDKDRVKTNGVKILGRGKINISLNVDLPVSKSAALKIEKAGGRVERDSLGGKILK